MLPGSRIGSRIDLDLYLNTSAPPSAAFCVLVHFHDEVSGLKIVPSFIPYPLFSCSYFQKHINCTKIRKIRSRRQLSPVSPFTEVEVHMAMDGAARSDTASASSTPTAQTTSALDIALTCRRRIIEQWRETGRSCQAKTKRRLNYLKMINMTTVNRNKLL